MADNVDITPGSGATIATDDIAGQGHFQKIKHFFGANDTATSPSTNTGASDAGTQRVVSASDDPVPTVLGTKTDAKNSATDTTSVSAISLLKQISYQLQQEQPPIINKFATSAGSTTGTAVSTVNIDTSGFTAVYEIEIINRTGADILQYTIGTTSAAPSDPSGANDGFLPGGGVPSSITLPNNNAVASIQVKLKSGSSISYVVTARGI